MKLSPDQIRKINNTVERIKSIDETIAWLGKDAAEKIEGHGKNIRQMLGNNRMRHLNDSDLGDVTFCAIINALLAQRHHLAATVKDIVEITNPPCPRQKPQNEELTA